MNRKATLTNQNSLPELIGSVPSSAVPWLLAAGLGLVTAAQFATHVPVMLGVALLMLGSTLAIRDRVPQQLRLLLVSLNLLTYLGLYALFLGAIMHQTTLWIPLAPPWFRLADLALSAWLVVLNLQLGVRQMQSAW